MPFLFPLGAVFIWAINTIVSKLSAGTIEPAAISLYRWVLALLVLTPFVLRPLLRRWREFVPHWWKLAILGTLGMVLYQSLAYFAAHSISAISMGIFTSLIPLLTILISVPVLRIAPTVGILCGSLLSFVGLVWLISQGNPAHLLHQGMGKGEWMMLTASTAYALYGVLTKRWALPLPTWPALYVQISFGVLLLIPLFLVSGHTGLTAQSLPLVLFAGIPASILAPFLWIQGILRLGANTTAIFMNLSPVMTAGIAILFLHEPVYSYHLLGGGITLLGVILAQQLRIPLSLPRRQKTSDSCCESQKK